MRGNDKGGERLASEMEFEDCDDDDFSYLTEEQYKIFEIDDSLCLENGQMMRIQGNELTPTSSMLYLQILSCLDVAEESECESRERIQEA